MIESKTIVESSLRYLGIAKVGSIDSHPELIVTDVRIPDGHEIFHTICDENKKIPDWVIITNLTRNMLFEGTKENENTPEISVTYNYIRDMDEEEVKSKLELITKLVENKYKDY